MPATKRFAILLLRFAVLGLSEELALLQRSLTWIDDEVILVIDYALELPAAHVNHEADARRHALIEPDVRDWHGEFDVAHALATDAGEGTSTPQRSQITPLCLMPLVLSAGALPIPGGTEDALAEQAAFFGLKVR
jgi:hypothetical protein